MNLECSSKGDKRFSALYAKVKIGNKYDSIENHYQLSKIFLNKETGKHESFNSFKTVKHIQYKNTHELIGFKAFGKSYNKSDLSLWYKFLWYKYLTNNIWLLIDIYKYDTFSDCFKKANTLNCQADIIRDVKEKGIWTLREEVKRFSNSINK